MDRKKREDLLPWAAAQNWLHLYETTIPTGRQDNFLTPAGQLLFVLCDLDGNVDKILYPPPMMPMPGPTIPIPNLTPRMDFRGGQFHPQGS